MRNLSSQGGNALELGIFGNPHFSTPPLFREDSFDPASRLRRGRFYVYRTARPYETNRVNHVPYAPPIGGFPLTFDMQVYESPQPSKQIRCSVRPVIFLGDNNYRTAWRIISIERLFNGESLFTLISTSPLGMLPDVNWAQVPPEKRAQVEQRFERVADAANRSAPESIVDACREFARLQLLPGCR